MSQADLLAAAQKRRGELEAAGEIDWVSDRQPYAVGQGPTPDNNLIGKKLEVRWRYQMIETGEPTYMWCEGEVVKSSTDVSTVSKEYWHGFWSGRT
ncbi:hypothetical protein AB1Y20_008176 [Prymnesium parvum]|uniref:Uncharacterized protein n=1 Tax=Prymnesium parvum TaxID=97485 RepID=A0AB34IU65_PRYPA